MSHWVQVITNFDQRLFLSINQLQSVKLNRIVQFITRLGGLTSQSLLVLTLFAFPPTRIIGMKLAIVQTITLILVQLLKLMVARVRPYHALTGIIPFKIEKDYSFPSGHTAASFATALILCSSFPVAGVLCFGVASLIGYSRIYIGVHYPLDVIVGCLIGLGATTLLMIGLF
ncbi:MAG TPA: phosphatase PAP2 family protein [Bacillota bacterium]|nr:phosphatase PAP2 family protein [Bacillota bacterium]